jgi:hypothetical protein
MLLFAFHRFAGLIRMGPALKQASADLRAALMPTGASTPAALRARAEPALRRMSISLSAAAVASETLVGLAFFGGKEQGIAWPLTTFALALGDLLGGEFALPVANRANSQGIVPLITFV